MASFLAGAPRLGFCSSDSARGRFNDLVSEDILTLGVGVLFGDRAVSLLNGFSGVVVAVGALVMLSFGFGAGSTFSGAAGAGTEEDGDGALDPSPFCSVFGVGGVVPDNFSRRLRRIYRCIPR